MIVFRRWRADHVDLYDQARELVTYEGDDVRATGWVEAAWLDPLLSDLYELMGIRFTTVAFQAYKDGTAACHWHADQNFDAQAILSLGASRMFGLRSGNVEELERLDAGDLLFMPSGFQDDWEHCVPPDPDVTAERISLVFRTNKGT